jgi:hypothetical protein
MIFPMRRLLLFVLMFAGGFPICFLLVSQIEDQLAAMSVSHPDRDGALLWSAFLALGIALIGTWRHRRKRRKQKPCTSVNCFSLHFRV